MKTTPKKRKASAKRPATVLLNKFVCTAKAHSIMRPQTLREHHYCDSLETFIKCLAKWNSGNGEMAYTLEVCDLQENAAELSKTRLPAKVLPETSQTYTTAFVGNKTIKVY